MRAIQWFLWAPLQRVNMGLTVLKILPYFFLHEELGVIWYYLKLSFTSTVSLSWGKLIPSYWVV